MDVIKLPLPIPGKKQFAASQFLYIRPDEYALFKCFTQHDRCILAGSPGISKSWFQWKFILFCYRLDLFDQFSPFEEKLRETSTEQEQKPFIPQLIVRTEAGSKSLFFFVGRNDTDVRLVEHTPQKLDRITDEHTTILWEPASITTPVYYSGVEARIIVTVSPNEDRIHEFKKRSEMLYMPCPSELQIRLMGQVYREFATNFEICPTDEEICELLRTLGPFIRMVLCWSDYQIAKFKNSRSNEIATIVGDNGLLQQALDNPEQIMPKGTPSHRLARYVVHRDSSDRLLGYAWDHYQFSSKEVLGVFCEAIAKLDIEEVIRHLIAVNQGLKGYEDARHVYLELLFKYHALTKLQWKSRVMLCGKSDGDLEWDDFSLKLDHVNYTPTTFKKMEAGVLYYPSDPFFPLVDLYYKDVSGKLVGIQATYSKKHPKKVETYEKFYKIIGTNPKETPLQLYYLILPCQVQHYSQDSYRDGQFWLDVGSGIGSEWRNNVTFYALVPPDDFRPIIT